MKNSVLISIKPKWCELIASGKKTIEIRKTKPKIDVPFKCYIYATKGSRPLVWGSPAETYIEDGLVQTYGYSKEEADRIFGMWNGKIIGEFICEQITDLRDMGGEEFCQKSCMTYEDWRSYTDGAKGAIYGWHISGLKIYEYGDLKELSTLGLKRPPQSWCYVEELRQ